jgi:hypothetical protein
VCSPAKNTTPYITDNQQQLASVLIECFFTDIQSLDYLDPENEYNSNNIEKKANEKKNELRRQLEIYVEEILHLLTFQTPIFI